MIAPGLVRQGRTGGDPELWEQYRTTGDIGARTRLLDRHVGLVHQVARAVARRVGDAYDVGDLVGAGSLGLVQAVEAYDPGRGHAFSTFATQRIRGAMLDELRAWDWRPRSVRAKGRRLAGAASQLQAELGRAPVPRELAGRLGVGVNELWRLRCDAEGGTLVSLTAPAGNGTTEEQGSTLEELLPNEGGDCPDRACEASDTAAYLARQIAALPAQERTVLALYYYEELTLREIAGVLHLTESRISQIHTQALRRLRGRITPLDRAG